MNDFEVECTICSTLVNRIFSLQELKVIIGGEFN